MTLILVDSINFPRLRRIADKAAQKFSAKSNDLLSIWRNSEGVTEK